MQFLALILPLLPALAPCPPQGDSVTPPPGMVLIPRGRTKIGSSQKDIERLVTETPTLQSNFGPLAGETPQITVDVGDFFLMVTETTNEQYAAYVRDSGSRPPQHWGADAITTAREAFLEEEGLKRKAARDAGEPPPERRTFDERVWWLQNWEGKLWKVPEGLECKPVVYVDYQDALGYARWAGLRLMTEGEYQRAVRADKNRPYAWGDAWEDNKYAATSEIQKTNDVFVVGNFPAGANEQGVFDLAGNVWEWTSSKYTPYKGYKAMKLSVGKGSKKKVLDTLPDFSPDHRVVVGGSFQNTRFAARATIRRGTDRAQQVNAMGFRCAASLQPGGDMAETLIRDIPPELRPQNVNGPVGYDPTLTMALDRWVPGKASCDLPKYAVIDDYDFIMFTPVEEVYQVTMKELREYSIEDHLVPIGVFGTNQPMMEPALEPGTYVLAFRGQGETVVPEVEEPADEDAAAPQTAPAFEPIESKIAIDIKKDNIVFINIAGDPVAAVTVERTEFSRPTAGSISVIDKTVKIEVPDGEKIEMVDEVQKWLQVRLAVPARARKVFKGKLDLRFAEEILTRDWRK